MEGSRLARPAASEAIDVTWVDPAGLPANLERVAAPDPGVTLDLEAGEPAALRRWSEFLAGVSRTTPKTATDPTSRVPAGCRHLKFGTIHPRTMVKGLNIRETGAGALPAELAFRDFYADVLNQWPRSAWWNWNANFDTIDVDTDASAEKRFEAWKQAAPDTRSSTRACASSRAAASCTTGSG